MELRARTSEAILDEERRKLKEGQPCPLCGSVEHPGIAHVHEAGGKADALFRQSEYPEKENACLHDSTPSRRDYNIFCLR